RNFRNEGISTQHNPEFTMLEFYQAYSDYFDLMELTEAMLRSVVKVINGGLEVEFRGERIDFARFRRYSMLEAIRFFWDEGPAPSETELGDAEALAALLDRLAVKYPDDANWGQLFGMLFEHVVEPKLIQPTFIYDFPVELSPLAKRKKDDVRFVERFELF